MPRLARMRSCLFLTLQPLATDLTLEIKCRRVRELPCAPQFGRKVLCSVKDGGIQDGELGGVEFNVREEVRVWGERYGVVVNSRVEEDHALVLRWE